jgi:hypothetical protein
MAKKSAIIKRDYEKNWKKSNYIPDENVIIIMDYDNGSFGLMVGDGKTNVNLLPNLIANKVVENNTLIL